MRTRRVFPLLFRGQRFPSAKSLCKSSTSSTVLLGWCMFIGRCWEVSCSPVETSCQHWMKMGVSDPRPSTTKIKWILSHFEKSPNYRIALSPSCGCCSHQADEHSPHHGACQCLSHSCCCSSPPHLTTAALMPP